MGSGRSSRPDLLKVLAELRNGKLKPVNILKMVPNPPRLAPTLNRVIDEVMHPVAEKNKTLYIVDSTLHAAVEVSDTLIQSLVKTVRYNVTRILGGE